MGNEEDTKPAKPTEPAQPQKPDRKVTRTRRIQGFQDKPRIEAEDKPQPPPPTGGKPVIKKSGTEETKD